MSNMFDLKKQEQGMNAGWDKWTEETRLLVIPKINESLTFFAKPRRSDLERNISAKEISRLSTKEGKHDNKHYEDSSGGIINIARKTNTDNSIQCLSYVRPWKKIKGSLIPEPDLYYPHWNVPTKLLNDGTIQSTQDALNFLCDHRLYGLVTLVTYNPQTFNPLTPFRFFLFSYRDLDVTALKALERNRPFDRFGVHFDAVPAKGTSKILTSEQFYRKLEQAI